MVFAAETLRNLIFAQWSLTGELSKTSTDTMKEVVQFFARPQIMGSEIVKAVEVIKNSAVEKEIIEQHPKFSTKTDVYLITVKYRCVDIQEVTYNNALNNLESMQTEILRIITSFFSNPFTNLGTFSTTNRQWAIFDNFNTAQPDLIRQLTLRLTEVISEDNTVFRGYAGVLVFDTSATTGDNKPGSDYQYTEAYNMRWDEGFANIPYLTNDTSKGIGVPNLVRSIFKGSFQADMYAKAADFGATLENLNKLFLVQANGETADVVFLPAYGSTSGQTLTQTLKVKVNRISWGADDEGLLTFKIFGEVELPSTFVVT